MKKFTGPRKLNKLKAKGSSVVLAFIGIIIIVIFAIGTWRTRFLEKEGKGITLAYTDYYSPKTQESSADIFKMINALNTLNTLDCPSDTLSVASGILYPSAQGSGSIASAFITSQNFINTDATEDANWFDSYVNTENTDPDAVDVETWRSHSNNKMYCLFDEKEKGDNSFVPIIAPFNFKFTSSNTDGKKICIESIPSGDELNTVYNITFTDVLAWFCAKPNKSQISYRDLKEHTQHGTIIGSSDQSYLQGGSAGVIIGFADKDTRVLVQKKETIDGTRNWVPISIAELYGY